MAPTQRLRLRSQRNGGASLAGRLHGSDTHAESAAAIFTIIASYRLHRLDPLGYLTDLLRVLPFWPAERLLELAPKNWAATRVRLDPTRLAEPVGVVEVPPALSTA
jgi:hypothetical protein